MSVSDETQKTPEFYAGILDTWMDEPVTRTSVARARAAFDELASLLIKTRGLRQTFSPYLLNVFLVTGKFRDFSALNKYIRETKQNELLVEVDDVIRFELPDVWIVSAIKRKDLENAAKCWFLNQEHPRIRHAAEAIIKAFPERVDMRISARLRQTDYQISRATRSRYRRACRILGSLKDDLAAANNPALWNLAMDEVLTRYGHRPALMDEFRKAGITH